MTILGERLPELDRFLDKKKVSQEMFMWHALRDIAEGLQHIHRHNVVHRDLKLENILLFPDNSLKLTDYGLSFFNTPRISIRDLEKHIPFEKLGLDKSKLIMEKLVNNKNIDKTGKILSTNLTGLEQGAASYSDDIMMLFVEKIMQHPDETKRFAGTAEFLAPETLHGDPYTVQSDIYQFGILCLELIYGTLFYTATSSFDTSGNAQYNINPFTLDFRKPESFTHFPYPANHQIGYLLIERFEQLICEGRYDSQKPATTFQDFLRHCFGPQESRFSNMDELLQHPWFTQEPPIFRAHYEELLNDYRKI